METKYPKEELKSLFRQIMSTSIKQNRLRMNNTLIIGGGFMGHSLALALKAANKDSAISVVEVIQEYRVLLEKSNIYDVVYNKIDQVNSKFHQVIICTTPETTSQILDLILKLFCHSQLITDISSSKSFLNGKTSC